MSKKIKTMPVCIECGSHKLLFDAYAEWNVETQEYELSSTFDDVHCEQCGGETKVEHIQVTPCECNGAEELCEKCGGSGFKPVDDES